MLIRIHIRDYALIEELAFAPATGLTVITGETGAGKSIVMDALALALGGRAQQSALRPGSGRAEVTAEFDVSGIDTVRSRLIELDLDDVDAPEHLSLRRTLSSDGRSRAYINGRPTTAQDLAEIAEALIDIHGQHAHQALTQRRYQLELLDAYGRLDPSVMEIHAAYRAWKDAQATLDEALRTNTNTAELSLLTDHLSELDVLDLDQLDYEALNDEHRALAHAEQWRATLEGVYAALAPGTHDDADRPTAAIRKMLALLQRVPLRDRELENARALLDGAMTHLDEAERELKSVIERLSPDPQRLQLLEERLSRVHQAARKHRVQAGDLKSFRTTLAARVERLRLALEDRPRLEAAVAAAYQHYSTLAQALSEERKRVATGFAHSITAQMTRLGMPNAHFEIAFDAGEFSNGIDTVEYRVSTNPKLPTGPLSRIASGGELSRMSLAIQVVAAERTRIPTLILDEADVGVGGATAEIIGQTLRSLATKTQILCITHVPQVASQGHHHALVTKDTDGTHLLALNEEARVREIARMIGGTRVTEKAIARAEEMVRLARGAN